MNNEETLMILKILLLFDIDLKCIMTLMIQVRICERNWDEWEKRLISSNKGLDETWIAWSYVLQMLDFILTLLKELTKDEILEIIWSMMMILIKATKEAQFMTISDNLQIMFITISLEYHHTSRG